jgi:CheY-like chemotaxis protein
MKRPPTKVLIIDDDKTVVSTVSAVLQAGGYKVASALDPVQGFMAVRRESPQVVVLDLMMPAGGGMQLLQRLSSVVNVPVIVITTGYDRTNGVVRLVVSDNGPGVPTADREKLFMPYYSTKGRGSGLGLAIVRRIVAEHGGGIEVGEASPKGTVFTVELPAA